MIFDLLEKVLNCKNFSKDNFKNADTYKVHIKPIVRRGRKATGLKQIAGLPG
jgi:hypothetical protein